MSPDPAQRRQESSGAIIEVLDSSPHYLPNAQMRIWQHFCIGAFILYWVFVATVMLGGFLEQMSPVKSTLCMLLMIFLPFILGPAAAVALIADIRARWVEPTRRSQWLWLCLLLWPVGLCYYFAYGFRKIPVRRDPPPLPPTAPTVAVPCMPFQSQGIVQKSKAAGSSLVWGAVSMVSPIFPLALPASLVGIIFGHKGLSEIKRSNGLFKNRGAAVGGLCLSYGSLILTGLMVMFWINEISSIRQEKVRNAPENLIGEPGYDAAREAERRMDAFITKKGDGNTTDARQLASTFSQGIVRVQELNYVPYSAASKTRVDSPPFVYCHLDKGTCAVLMQLSIPVVLTPKEQDELYSVFWAELHDVVAAEKALEPGARLALALAIRDHLNYKAIYLGEFQRAPADELEIPKLTKPAAVNDLETRRLFYSYFAATSPKSSVKTSNSKAGVSEASAPK